MKSYKMNEKRYYRFHLDVVCRKFILDDYQDVIVAHSLREAWKLIKHYLPYDLHHHGYFNPKVLKVFFKFCDVFSLDHQYICTLKSIK